MKVFLSGLESSEKNIIDELIAKKEKVDNILTSYYYLRKKENLFTKLKKISKEILIDSGAHSFQKGTKVEWEKYTKEYANWIKENDCNQIIGYFEMDVDNMIGYQKVLQLRKILESQSEKIIPVWHKNRGIQEYKEMCNNYQYVAITGFKNEDIKDDQYLMFLKYAKQHNCQVHCLGMTRVKILNKIPFDSVDSSTWKQAGNFGEYRKFQNGKLEVFKQKGKFTTEYLDKANFQEFTKLQQFYKEKWKNFKKRFAKSLITKLRSKTNERIIIIY